MHHGDHAAGVADRFHRGAVVLLNQVRIAAEAHLAVGDFGEIAQGILIDDQTTLRATIDLRAAAIDLLPNASHVSSFECR